MSIHQGHLYIIQSEEGPVKIGISIKPKERIAALESTSGRRIVRTFISPKMECFEMLEDQLHSHFSEHRTVGEWFHISFKEAVRAARMFGAAVRPKEWATSEDYVQGALHRKRLFEFQQEGEHTAGEWNAFLAGLGPRANEQIEYADHLDNLLGAQIFKEMGESLLLLMQTEHALGITRTIPQQCFDQLKEIGEAIKDDMREAGMQVDPFWGS